MNKPIDLYAEYAKLVVSLVVVRVSSNHHHSKYTDKENL